MTDSSSQGTLPAAATLGFVGRLRRRSKASPQNHDAPINLACPFFSATFRLVVCPTYGIMTDVQTGQGSPSASARGAALHRHPTGFNGGAMSAEASNSPPSAAHECGRNKKRS